MSRHLRDGRCFWHEGSVCYLDTAPRDTAGRSTRPCNPWGCTVSLRVRNGFIDRDCSAEDVEVDAYLYDRLVNIKRARKDHIDSVGA
jgi:hypothetical protein